MKIKIPALLRLRRAARVASLYDEDLVLRWIGEISGAGPGETRGRLLKERLWPGWNNMAETRRLGFEPHVYQPEADRFYESSAAALYEHVIWNVNLMKVNLRVWILEHLERRGRPLKILCFGDGIGAESLCLAGAGHEVTYFELSGPSSAFAGKLFAREGAAVRRAAGWQDLAAGSFDAVLCLDVLEHVQDPGGLLRRLAGLLGPGGEMLLHAPFGAISFSLPLHLSAHRRLYGRADFFSGCGLRPLRAGWLWMPVVLRAEGPGTPRAALASSLNIGVNGLMLRFLALPFVFSSLDFIYHCLNAVLMFLRHALAGAARLIRPVKAA